MPMTWNIEELSDHEIFGLLKEQDADAWQLVYRKSVLTEAKSLRSARMAWEAGITPEELMGILYEEMIGDGKIELYRDDGGSLFSWLRTYVRGYVYRAVVKRHPEISIDGVSEEGEQFTIPTEDLAMDRNDEWAVVQKCFGEMWSENPMRAYVHLLKLRMNLSSAQIMEMLGISSTANVDQIFARAVKDMGRKKVEHEC
jgi:hypothetical protein